MKVFFALFVFFLLVLQSAHGQVESIRKLQQKLPAIRDSAAYVDALNKISLLLYEQDVDSTLLYAGQARNLARRLRYAKGMADATNNFGIAFDIKGNTPLALRYYNDAFNQYSSIGDSSNMVQTLMNIALVYNINGNDQKAISNFKRTMLLGSNITHDSIMALVIYNFILVYPGQFKADSVNNYIEKAVRIAKKYNDTRLLLAIDQLKADNYIKTGQRSMGIELLQQIVRNGLQMKLYYLCMDPLIDLGDQFVNTDTAQAVAYYKQALAITEQNSFNSYSKQVIKKLYGFYAANNKTAQAYYYSKKLLKIYGQEENTNNASGIDYIEYALKDQQLEAVSVNQAYSIRFLWLAATICVLAVAIIILLWRNGRRNQKTHAVLKANFEQLESATAALENSNKNYARLIRVVAHDLRNPIGAINSISALLMEDGITDSEEKEWVGLIHLSSKSCLQLIGELLEADFNLKEETLNKEDVDLAAMLLQTVKLSEFSAKEKNNRLFYKIL